QISQSSNANRKRAGLAMSRNNLNDSLAGDVKFMEHVPAKDDKKLRSESCKPSTLRCARKPKQTLSVSTPESSVQRPTAISAIADTINEFLCDVKCNGYVLPSTQSDIDQRLSRLEGREHILSPISETPESYPGVFQPMTLTYRLPQVNSSTKPSLSEPPKAMSVQRKESPSAVWSRLGSRAYHFVGEDRFVHNTVYAPPVSASAPTATNINVPMSGAAITVTASVPTAIETVHLPASSVASKTSRVLPSSTTPSDTTQSSSSSTGVTTHVPLESFTEESSTPDGLSGGVIAGIITAVLGAFILFIIALILWRKTRTPISSPALSHAIRLHWQQDCHPLWDDSMGNPYALKGLPSAPPPVPLRHPSRPQGFGATVIPRSPVRAQPANHGFDFGVPGQKDDGFEEAPRRDAGEMERDMTGAERNGGRPGRWSAASSMYSQESVRGSEVGSWTF
ncbi:hypothetical protein HII31_04127, partial [Pseudocercospora fuligena]